jgi:DNA-binding PadR family transcriptional regulator
MSSMKPDLPITSYIVLGLLSFSDEMSGYDIRKAAENLQYFYWSPAQSQIYAELRRLAAHKLVSSRSVRQEGKPDKQLFHLTSEGTAVFQQWLTHAPLPPIMLKQPVLLKLFFGHMADTAAMAQMLRQYIVDITEILGQLAVVAEYMGEVAENEYGGMIVEWSSHFYTGEREMAQKLLAQFEAQIGEP